MKNRDYTQNSRIGYQSVSDMGSLAMVVRKIEFKLVQPIAHKSSKSASLTGPMTGYERYRLYNN